MGVPFNLKPIPTTHTKLDHDGTLVVERWQDVEPVLEHNKVLRGLSQKSDWGKHVAAIPLIFYEKWLNEELERGNVHLRMFSHEFDQIVKRKLQDPDYKAFRVDK